MVDFTVMTYRTFDWTGAFMGEQLSVLFVDDEERFLKSIATRLNLRGFSVSAFTDAQEALAVAERVEFDVAVVDLKMPKMGGEELLTRLKQRWPDLEVIVLTGHGSISSAVACGRAGVFEYLQKPCEIDVLIRSLFSAYAQRVRSRNERAAEEIDSILSHSGTYSHIQLVERLKQIATG